MLSGHFLKKSLSLKAPITIAADTLFFLFIEEIKVDIWQTSHMKCQEIFPEKKKKKKKKKKKDCRLLLILFGALRLNFHLSVFIYIILQLFDSFRDTCILRNVQISSAVALSQFAQKAYMSISHT